MSIQRITIKTTLLNITELVIFQRKEFKKRKNSLSVIHVRRESVLHFNSLTTLQKPTTQQPFIH